MFLCAEKSNYHLEGAPASSAGYMPGKRIILFPLQSLSVKESGRSYTVEHDEGNKALSHEITH